MIWTAAWSPHVAFWVPWEVRNDLRVWSCEEDGSMWEVECRAGAEEERRFCERKAQSMRDLEIACVIPLCVLV